MNIKQLHVNYIPEEDRMVLTIDGQDTDQQHLYLTRRFVQLAADALLDLFIFAAKQHAHQFSDDEQQYLLAMEHQQALAERNKNQGKFAIYPAEKHSEQPILVTQLFITQFEKDNQLVLSFIGDRESSRIDLCINNSLLHSLYASIANLCEHAQWDIPFSVTHPPEITLDKRKLN
ncbi:MAG: hypothetical protein KIT27_11915 [Legionellales bacterium]|nr:hypothetical protein [Legionellales bacterium]